MNMDGDDGLRFYVFDDIADEKAFKTTYRSAMDELPIDQAMADLIEEANHAFHLNMNMFKELEGNLVAAIGKVLFGLTRRQRAGGGCNGLSPCPPRLSAFWFQAPVGDFDAVG